MPARLKTLSNSGPGWNTASSSGSRPCRKIRIEPKIATPPNSSEPSIRPATRIRSEGLCIYAAISLESVAEFACVMRTVYDEARLGKDSHLCCVLVRLRSVDCALLIQRYAAQNQGAGDSHSQRQRLVQEQPSPNHAE